MSAETIPVLLTGPMCMAMPVGTAVELAEPRHGVWHAKTSELTWAFFWRTRPTPEQIWQAVEERCNNLSPYPSGLAFVYEPPAKPEATPAPLDPSKAGGPFGKGDTVRRTSETPLRYAGLGITPGRNFTVREGTEVPNGVISVEATRGVLDAALFELVTRATAHQPAPEPEPEWKPGTTGTATLNSLVSGASSLGMRAMRVIDEDGTGSFVFENSKWIRDDATTWSVSDFVPATEALNREHLAGALAHRYGDHDNLGDTSPSTQQDYLNDADAVLALLRGESL